MSKFESKRGNWIITIPLAAGVLLYFLFVFFPTSKKIEMLRIELKQKRDFIAQADQLRSKIKQVENQVREARDYCRSWSEKTPDEAAMPEVYSRISEQVLLSGCSTTRFDPLEVEELETIRRIPIAFGSHGKFSQIFTLIGLLEEMPERICLEDVRLSPPRKNSEDTKLEAKLVIFADKSEKTD